MAQEKWKGVGIFIPGRQEKGERSEEERTVRFNRDLLAEFTKGTVFLSGKKTR